MSLQDGIRVMTASVSHLQDDSVGLKLSLQMSAHLILPEVKKSGEYWRIWNLKGWWLAGRDNYFITSWFGYCFTPTDTEA
jgi:hypothetical protein